MLARKKSGFTLIELLVVIAIIAILAAILFPVFARAREAARKSTCQSNMKECAIALQTYWNDYDATLPSSAIHWDTATTDPAWSTARYANFGTIAGELPPKSTATYSNPSWAQVLYNHMKNKDIMFCPSDSADHNTATATISYWWKYAIDYAWNDSAVKCQKEGDYGFNADQVVFYESKGWHFGDSLGFKDGVQINCAFLDSHVKTISLKNTTTGTGYTATTTAASGEPYFFNYYAGEGTAPSPNPANQAWYDPRQYMDKF